jgi:hypothetical protein
MEHCPRGGMKSFKYSTARSPAASEYGLSDGGAGEDGGSCRASCPPSILSIRQLRPAGGKRLCWGGPCARVPVAYAQAINDAGIVASDYFTPKAPSSPNTVLHLESQLGECPMEQAANHKSGTEGNFVGDGGDAFVGWWIGGSDACCPSAQRIGDTKPYFTLPYLSEEAQ